MKELQKRLSRWALPVIVALTVAVPVWASYVIPNGSVTTAKLASGAVTQAKRAALGLQVSSSSGSFTTTSASLVDVTNLSVTAVSTGRPMFVGMVPDGTGGAAMVSATLSVAAVAVSGNLDILEDAVTFIGPFSLSHAGASATLAAYWPCPAYQVIYTPAAGSHTYKVQASRTSANLTVAVSNCKLVAYEL